MEGMHGWKECTDGRNVQMEEMMEGMHGWTECTEGRNVQIRGEPEGGNFSLCQKNLIISGERPAVAKLAKFQLNSGVEIKVSTFARWHPIS